MNGVQLLVELLGKLFETSLYGNELLLEGVECLVLVPELHPVLVVVELVHAWVPLDNQVSLVRWEEVEGTKGEELFFQIW